VGATTGIRCAKVRNAHCVRAAAIALTAGYVAVPAATPADAGTTHWRELPGQLRVGTPAWYSPARNPPLPLVIAPHARSGDPAKNARRWGDLPGSRSLIVLAPQSTGRIAAKGRAWGYPPSITKLARTPQIAKRFLPWLRWDPDRVYTAGFSMGAQQSLLLLARRPDLFAAVAVADSLVDFLRRWYEFPRSPLASAEQPKATREVGGTPARLPWLYQRRSPMTYARTIAFSGVPMQLWWNPREQLIINQETTQSGRLWRLIRRLNSDALVDAVVHRAPHGEVFRSTHSLSKMVDFLLAHERAGPPRRGFSYVSWLRRVGVWGWDIRSGDVGHGFWQIDSASDDGFRSSSRSWLAVSPPRRPVGAVVDGDRVRLRGGVVRLTPGRHGVELTYEER
jgi:pimeloyl-ACP methyl ester carboxylesterase